MLKFGMAAGLLLLASACDRDPALPGTAQVPAGNVAEAPAGDNLTAATEAAAPAATALAPLTGAEATAMMKRRHDNFEKMGDAAKASFKALEASSPDMTVIAKSAATIAGLAPQLPSWFPPGTGREAGKTHAREEVWQQPEEFRARHADFAKAATAYDAAAKSGDVAAVKAAFADLGKSCKGCHDKFRIEEKK